MKTSYVRCPACPATAVAVSAADEQALVTELRDHIKKEHSNPWTWEDWYVPLNCHQ